MYGLQRSGGWSVACLVGLAEDDVQGSEPKLFPAHTFVRWTASGSACSYRPTTAEALANSLGQ